MTLYTVIAQQIFCLKIVIVRKTIQFQRVAKCHNDSPVLQLRNSTIVFALQFSQKFQGSYSEYAFPQDFCEVNQCGAFYNPWHSHTEIIHYSFENPFSLNE